MPNCRMGLSFGLGFGTPSITYKKTMIQDTGDKKNARVIAVDGQV